MESLHTHTHTHTQTHTYTHTYTNTHTHTHTHTSTHMHMHAHACSHAHTPRPPCLMLMREPRRCRRQPTAGGAAATPPRPAGYGAAAPPLPLDCTSQRTHAHLQAGHTCSSRVSHLQVHRALEYLLFTVFRDWPFSIHFFGHLFCLLLECFTRFCAFFLYH